MSRGDNVRHAWELGLAKPRYQTVEFINSDGTSFLIHGLENIKRRFNYDVSTFRETLKRYDGTWKPV